MRLTIIESSFHPCKEDSINAGQTDSSMYPSIFNRLRAIARYWSENATFSGYPPLHLTPPLGCSHEFREKFGPQKTKIMGYQAVKTV